MKLYHGSYRKIERFEEKPIWCSNVFDTANNYILCQSNDEANGFFGYMYEVEIDDSVIVFVDDFTAVDCGEILNTMEGEVFSAENDGRDRIFCIRNAAKFSFKEI